MDKLAQSLIDKLLEKAMSQKSWVAVLSLLALAAVTAFLIGVLTWKSRALALEKHRQNVDKMLDTLAKKYGEQDAKFEEEKNKVLKRVLDRQKKIDVLQAEIDRLKEKTKALDRLLAEAQDEAD